MALRNPVIADGLTADDLVENVLTVFALATSAQVAAGLEWYPTAHRQARCLGELAGFRGDRAVQVGAGVLAALSPALDWDANVKAAADVVRFRRRAGWAVRQSGANVAKALRILDGVDPLDVLGGRKVRAFYASILGDVQAVCVDRHAVSLAYGRHLDAGEFSSRVGGAARYAALQDVYRVAAGRLGLDPTAVQAVTWVAWRELKAGSRAFELVGA